MPWHLPTEQSELVSGSSNKKDPKSELSYGFSLIDERVERLSVEAGRKH